MLDEIKFIIVTEDMNIKNLNFIKDYNFEDFSKEEYNSDIGIMLTFKDENEKDYSVKIKKNKYNNHIQIKVSIKGTDGIQYDEILERLKIDLMKTMVESITNSYCYWVKDTQSEKLSKEIYIKINQLENRLRSFINMCMINKIGINWWDKIKYIEKEKKYYDKEKTKNKSLEYIREFPIFSGIRDELLTLNADDLTNIMTLEIKEWEKTEENLQELERMLKTSEILNIKNTYNNQCVIIEKVWETIFKEYLTSDFLGRWKNFCKMRNHIAHNKLVSFEGIKRLDKNIESIKKMIKTAETLFQNKNLTNEEIKYLDEDKRQEECNFDEFDFDEFDSDEYKKEIAEEESGVQVRSEIEIIEEFENKLRAIWYFLDDNNFSNDNIEIIESKESVEELNEIPKEIKIIDKFKNNIININFFNCMIDETEGAESRIFMSYEFNDVFFKKAELIYTNGKYYYDTYQGNYMPYTQDEFIDKEFEELLEEIFEILNKNFKDKYDWIEEIKKEKDIFYNELECIECGEESILNQNYRNYSKDTCLCCEEVNKVGTCARCSKPILILDHEEIKFCKSCLDFIENQ